MAMYTYKERNDMFKNSKTSIAYNRYLIMLANYDNKKEINVARINAEEKMGRDYENKKILQRNIVEMLLKTEWEIVTEGNKKLTDIRVKVENKLLDDKFALSREEAQAVDRKRLKALAKQPFRIFEMYLAVEVKEKLGIDLENKKIKDAKVTLKDDKAIYDFIYSRVKAFYNGEFTYEEKKHFKDKEEEIETIGV